MSLDLSVKDAAAFLGVSQGSVRRWCDTGVLRHKRTPGGQRRFSQEDLDAFLASLTPSDEQKKGAA